MTFSLLQTARDTAAALVSEGFVDLAYITAGFEPFSSAQKPDILFRPFAGPNTASLFVTELRLGYDSDRAFLNPGMLSEHREFIQEDSDVPIVYAIAASISISAKLYADLFNIGITVFDSIGSSRQLSNSIGSWAQAPMMSTRHENR